MTSKTTAQWISVLEKKFERQVGATSVLRSQWLSTASSGVEQKGEQYFRRSQLIFQNSESMRILDAGCGDGSIALRLAIAGADVTGVDVDCEFIDVAQLHSAEEYPQTPIHFICADLCDHTSFSDSGFDLIISVDVIEHVPDAVRYMETLKAKLNPGGKIWLFTPNRFAVQNIFRDPHYRLSGLTLLPNAWAAWYVVHIRHRTNQYDVGRLYTQRSLKKLTSSCNLDVTYQSEMEFDRVLQDRPLLKKFAAVPMLRAGLYSLYMCRMDTIEAVLS